MAPETLDRCAHNGGTGAGAGHECRCVRPAGHALDSDRPHGCTCGALWSDAAEEARAMTLDLEHLRRVAEAATPGPWSHESDWVSEDGTRYRPARAWTTGGTDPWGEANDDYVLSRGASNDDATHIATFDPPTVLALIDRLEAAEAKVAEAQRAALAWKRRAEDAEEAIGRVVALADRWDAMTPNERAPVRLSAGVLREALGDYDEDEGKPS